VPAWIGDSGGGMSDELLSDQAKNNLSQPFGMVIINITVGKAEPSLKNAASPLYPRLKDESGFL
jgi:hypothetical protein